MRSRIPKVLHPLAGRPLIDHVLDALAAAGVERPVVVTGHGAEPSRRPSATAPRPRARSRSAGPPTRCASASSSVPIATRVRSSSRWATRRCMPAELLFATPARAGRTAARRSRSSRPAWPDPTGYGRIVRGADGGAAAIVEEADADDADARHRRDQRRHLRLRRSPGCARRSAACRPSASGELYLTDRRSRWQRRGLPGVRRRRADDPADAIGINDRVALAAAEERMRRRIAETHMRNGVTIVDPATTRIDAGVEIGQDARIEPWTILSGSHGHRPGRGDRPERPRPRQPHRPAHDGLGQRRRGVDRRRGRARSARSRTCGPDAQVGAALPDRQLRRDQEQPARGGHPAASLQLPRRRRDRRGRQRRRRLGDGQLRRHAPSTAPTIGDRASLGVDTMMVAPVTIGEGATTGAGLGRHARRARPARRWSACPARPIEPRRTARDRRSSRQPRRRRGTRPVRDGTEPVEEADPDPPMPDGSSTTGNPVQ